MAIPKETKTRIMNDMLDKGFTSGHVETQCAILYTNIRALTEHCKIHHKDHASRRGLLMMVGHAKKLLEYVKRTSDKNYTEVTNYLGLKKK